MRFVDLQAQYQRIAPSIQARLQRVLEHGQFIMGPEIAELEAALAKFAGAKHCLSYSSGTDALVAPLMALGVGPGDEVITTPFTFVATAEAVALVGATTVFVDIDRRTYNIDPKAIERAITPRTKAIIPVSLFGQMPDLEAINALAARHKLTVMEDAAQSFGATRGGRRSCGVTRLAATSFFPAKPLGGYGDGGACFTDDDGLATVLREIRIHGQDRPYHYSRVGLNGRLDTLQAAILLAKLEVFDDELARRERVARRYDALLKGLVEPPFVEPGATSAWAQYTIEVDQRERVRERLTQQGIPTNVYYPAPLNRDSPYARAGGAPTPNAEAASKRVMSLPFHPYLSEADQDRVVAALRAALV